MISIVDEDHSPLSARIATSFYPPYFVVPRLISPGEMDSRMDAGLDTFALDIPPNFQRDLLAERTPTIQLNVDATRMTQAFNGAGYIQIIVTDEIAKFIDRYRGVSAPPVELTLRARFNQELNKAWFGSINNVISAITMLSIVLTGAALIREREHGTIEHLLVMPVTPFEIMLSKIWSMGLVVFLASAFSLICVVQGLLSVPVQGLRHPVSARRSPADLRYDLHGHIPGDSRRIDAAVRPAADAVSPAASDAVRRHYAAREHAGDHSDHYARSAQHPLRHPRAGDPVSWRRPGYRVATLLALIFIGSILFYFSLQRFRQFLR